MNWNVNAECTADVAHSSFGAFLRSRRSEEREADPPKVAATEKSFSARRRGRRKARDGGREKNACVHVRCV